MSIFSNGTKFNNAIVYNEQSLTDFIETNYVQLSPDAKLNGVLEYISQQTTYDGQSKEFPTPPLLKIVQMYFYNASEWAFYFQSAVSQEFVSKRQIGLREAGQTVKFVYALTVKGLSRLITVTEGKSSKFCFIAMAFEDDMFNVVEQAIKPALSACGFNHLIVSDEHIDSDKTINDAILAGIKKSRFTIADFTYHRGGVYFEAGFALGRGQKVIYTCRHDHMGKAHFDIRNYQHIVWTDATDFKKKLVDKIEAFIKD